MKPVRPAFYHFIPRSIDKRLSPKSEMFLVKSQATRRCLPNTCLIISSTVTSKMCPQVPTSRVRLWFFANMNYWLFSPSASTSASATSTSTSSSTSAPASLLGRIFRRQSSLWSSPALDSAIYPNTTLGRTLLNASELVKLPGNNSQVLAWTRSDENSNITILNQVYVSTSSPPFFFFSSPPTIHLGVLFKRWFTQVLMSTPVKTSLSSTRHSGTPYSSPALTGYLSLQGTSLPLLTQRTRLLLPAYYSLFNFHRRMVQTKRLPSSSKTLLVSPFSCPTIWLLSGW